ncbi:divergent PAP2 family protein [Amygdalobacter indicium]|uniref:Divergent PAP2 family protein n=1 Tax=Amygdalobacter indicium TaxID=3029272 RepID=A0ABY8C3G8_9FIRM|nr:divergent PAP2 family protein [Amygdalobacter indicium]WEG35221.1 divergent PAP2 family protein [Amygdalobacter indicium]
MRFWSQICDNYYLGIALLAWFIAQLLKIFIDGWRYRKFDFKKIVSSGGMPSSHAATVCALANSVGLNLGYNSVQFATCAVVAIIVMYDASGVRRETGKQARLLNLLLSSDAFAFDGLDSFDETLKELVGHTPLQVFMGAVLGCLIAYILRMY